MKLPINEIVCGSALDVMKQWPDNSIDCCVTSPPYYGLRDYGVKGQLGLEKTPEEFVAKMVEIFAEVKRVLKPEGTLWMNLGDSYVSGKGRYSSVPQTVNGGKHRGEPIDNNRPDLRGHDYLKDKDLAGTPWRVAFALQQDGWYLRQDIIWHKPNPMPESVTDRCTKAHEYIFLMTKNPRYYYDSDAIKEESVDPESHKGRRFRGPKAIVEAGARPFHNPNTLDKGNEADGKTYPKRNKRSVWTIVTMPCPVKGVHFATFPPKLIEPCILAGCPEWVCKKCGKARVRIVGSIESKVPFQSKRYTSQGVAPDNSEHDGGVWQGKTRGGTTGWTDCGCGAGWIGGICLDPFMGSGTTGMVAYENRRNWIGIELNPEYIKMNRADKAKEKYGLFE